ncbi:MAG: hypothetical protein KF724_12845 [Phycisphaeraceae bacterium]|nr:hypothetical protein [Phycisphaeraceae bacterium]
MASIVESQAIVKAPRHRIPLSSGVSAHRRCGASFEASMRIVVADGHRLEAQEHLAVSVQKLL